ncbi:MAG: hypothetical protein AUJ49_01190 [Desulfovibrionaceae bacterium CG1_02_65_16]|nr:MAG: hypothetical protein AUJ49_01190 [Desulfovibrionaceae bacterium CG1_02_65_16]
MDDLALGLRRLRQGDQPRAVARNLHARLERLREGLVRVQAAERHQQERLAAQVAQGPGRARCEGLLTSAVDFLEPRLNACAALLNQGWVELLAWDAADRAANARRDMLAAGRLARAGRLAAARRKIEGLLRTAPDHPAARALLKDLRDMGGEARRLALALARGRSLGLRRGPIPLPLPPRTLASDDANMVFVSAFDDRLNAGLYACDVATGAVRLLRGPDTVYSGTWFDSASETLYALIYRVEGKPVYGVDSYARDGRHVRRRLFGAHTPRLALPCLLQGGGGLLYLFEYPCGLVLGVDPESLRLVEVVEHAILPPPSNYLICDGAIFTVRCTLGIIDSFDLSSGEPGPFAGANLPNPHLLSADMTRGAVFATSSERPLAGYEPQPNWLHRYGRDGRRLYSRRIGDMSLMDMLLMRESGVLVLGERTTGLIFLDTRGGRGDLRPLPENGLAAQCGAPGATA